MFAIFYPTVENRKMNNQQFLQMSHEALRVRGVDVDELMNKHQSETAIAVHWTDAKIRTGFCFANYLYNTIKLTIIVFSAPIF